MTKETVYSDIATQSASRTAALAAPERNLHFGSLPVAARIMILYVFIQSPPFLARLWILVPGWRTLGRADTLPGAR